MKMSHIENNILYIIADFNDFTMTINLSVLVNDVGRVVCFKDIYGTYRQIVMKKSEAKRLIRYILPYVNGEDLLKMAMIFEDNETLKNIFLTEVKKGRRYYDLVSTGTCN